MFAKIENSPLEDRDGNVLIAANNFLLDE